MLAFVLILLFLGSDADDDYYGDLPGDVTSETSNRGYPGELMSEDIHGAGHYSSWSVTNGFGRFYTINFDAFNMKGEPKHGLWKWTVPGAGDEADIWWCEMGGSWDTNVDSGHVDNDNQQNMEKLWEVIRNSENVNEVGPLAEDAKLMDIAVNAIRLYIAPMGSVWLNEGTSTEPAYRAHDLDDSEVEFYFIELLYGYSDIPYFMGNQCDGSNSDDCINLHDSVVAVIKKEITEEFVGLPIFGLHYGNLTSAGACPSTCGEGPCDCDLVLVDMSLDAPLGTSWAEDEFFVPHWVLGNEVSDVCSGLNYENCGHQCGTCAWVCRGCRECSGPGTCPEYTYKDQCETNTECSWECPTKECALIPRGSPTGNVCEGLERASCLEQCASCAWVCPTCKECSGVGSCSENIFKSQCVADASCGWLGCQVDKVCISV